MFPIRYRVLQHMQTPRVHRTIRKASTETGKKGDRAKHHEGPKTEPLGMQLYIVLAAIPICYGTYVLSQPSKDGTAPALSQLLGKYSDFKDRWATRNNLHVKLLEQVAHDRHLFYGSEGSSHIDLRFPEVFNSGSPYNIPAGHGANLDKLVAHYKTLNAEEDERRARSLAAKKDARK